MKARLFIGLLFVVLVGITLVVTNRDRLRQTDANHIANTSGLGTGTIQPDLRARLISGLRGGDVNAFADYLAEEVTLTLDEESDFLSPANVKNRLAAFFRANPPQSFEERHQGSSKQGDTQYLIGNLRTSSGAFRVYVLIQGNRILEMEFSESPLNTD